MSHWKSYIRGNKREFLSKKEDLVFQALSWEKQDVFVKEEEYSLEQECEPDYEGDDYDYDPTDFIGRNNNNNYGKKKFMAHVFGVTKEGKSVCLEIHSFQPHFYLRIHPYFAKKNKLPIILSTLRQLVSKQRNDLISIDLVSRKKLYGFTWGRQFPFLRLNFINDSAKWEYYKKLLDEDEEKKMPIESLKAVKTVSLMILGKKTRFDIYEGKFDSTTRLIDVCDVNPAGWIKIKKQHLEHSDVKSTCQLNYRVHWKKLIPLKKTMNAPFRVASFDIECTSGDGNFPQANRPKDKIIQIGTTYRIHGQKHCFLRHIVTLKQCAPIDSVLHKNGFVEHVVVDSCLTEREVLYKWANMITMIDPDVIIGYNIFGFDWDYMYKRASVFGFEDFATFGRIRDLNCKVKNGTLASKAMGYNKMVYPFCKGRIQIDLLKVIQREHKLPSFKLDKVASHFLKMNKEDLLPHEIFNQFNKGKPKNIRTIATYCLKDCLLVNNLFDYLHILTNSIGMANVCHVIISVLFLKGQTAKTDALISRECRLKGYCFPTLRPGSNKSEIGYEGAIVLEPKIGFYSDPITVPDFSSLYPSCIIENNMSHETRLTEQDAKKLANNKDYVVNKISFNVYEGKGKEKKIVGVKDCYFVEKIGERGVICSLLIDLLAARKRVKKEMKNVKDDAGYYAILNGLQLAYKITCNSVYGYTGAKTSKLRNPDIAASTTAAGRNRIMVLKKYIESEYKGAVVVYGDTDSVFIDFSGYKTMKGKKGKARIKEAIRLGQEAAEAHTKTLRYPQNLEYEKVFCPFILFTKKRYAGVMYEFSTEKSKFKSMGLVTKRRDNAPIVKKIFQGVLDILMKEKNTKKAVKYYYTCIKNLLAGNIPLDDLIISATLGHDYKDPTKISHKVLAEKVKIRDPGNAFATNDRVPYVYIDAKMLKCKICSKVVNTNNCKCIACMELFCVRHLREKDHKCQPRCRKCWTTQKIDFCDECDGSFCPKHIPPHNCNKFCKKNGCNRGSKSHKCGKITTKALQGDLLETPDYVEKHNLRIDYRYYFDHQIAKPVGEIFALIEETKNKKLLGDLLIKDSARSRGSRLITSFIQSQGRGMSSKKRTSKTKRKAPAKKMKSMSITSFFS